MSRRSLGRRSPSSSVKEAACATPVLSEIKDTALKEVKEVTVSFTEVRGRWEPKMPRFPLRPPTRNHRRVREAQAIAFFDEWE